MSKLPRPPARRRPASFIPRVEALEGRDLPAPVTYAVLPGNVLRVQGTNGPDQITIFDNGGTGVNNVAVVANHRTFLPGVAITGILVRTGNGNDSVHYNLIGSMPTGAARTVTVYFGMGFNQFNATLRGNLGTRAVLSILVNGSNGTDNMNVRASSDIGSRAALTFQEIGGRANPNTLSLNYTGQLVGALTAFASGGAGADRISQLFTLNPGSSGSLSAEEQGGAGNDSFTLADTEVSLFDSPAIAALINTGLGFKTVFATRDVTVTGTAATTRL